MSEHGSSDPIRRALTFWLLLFVIATAIAAFHSEKRTVTAAYRTASEAWLAGVDLYTEGIHGYLYLPQAAIAYIPFASMPHRLGKVLWRACGVFLLATAVWRMAGLEDPKQRAGLFLLMTVAVIPVAMNSTRNGQMNLPLAGLMAYSAVDLARRRWSLATLWVTLGLALKPLMMVLCLLAAALLKPMRRRLVVGIVVLFLFPFFLAPPAYVFEQYGLFIEKSSRAANPVGIEPFSDFFGLLGILRIHPSFATQSLIRLIAALLTLTLCGYGYRRWGHVPATLLMFSYASCYLLLFNPRTENNTYVLAGIPLAIWAGWTWFNDHSRVATGLLMTVSVLMTVSYYLVRKDNYWLCPGLCLLFVAYMTGVLFIRRFPPSPS